MLPLQGAGVPSLVGELRSCMPHGVAKKKSTGMSSVGWEGQEMISQVYDIQTLYMICQVSCQLLNITLVLGMKLFSLEGIN